MSVTLSVTGVFGPIGLAASLSSVYDVVRIGGTSPRLVFVTTVCSTSVSLFILKICIRDFKAWTLEDDNVNFLGIIV